jgi:hypothetical protein
MADRVPRLLRVRNWSELFENNRSRELTRTNWFPVPNDLSAGGYLELVSHADGAAHLGVWLGLLMVASRAKPRGLLVREDGRLHTPDSLALVTRLSEPVISNAIDRLLQIGLLEISGNKLRKKSNLASHLAAVKPQAPAPRSQDGAAEGNGTEHHHQEGKGTGSKRTRTEPQGTERAHESKTEHPVETSKEPSFSERSADDDENAGTHYASPDDELKAIYEAKTSERMTVEVIDAIRLNLELTGVGMSEFVAETKKHAKNEWRNPPGFLRDLSRRFRAKTCVAGGPVTAAEAAERNYLCTLCASRVRGEGAVLGEDGRPAPCACASPEWIDRQRRRGVFAGGTTQ